MDSWYKVVTPCKEACEGRSFNSEEFAVALEQVVAGTAPPDYRNPQLFFARTYFTRALAQQIGIVLRRLSGQTVEPPPVLSFITQFGGGKTHMLAALYHLATRGPAVMAFAGVGKLVETAGLQTVPTARVGVFVGNAWDPRDGRGTPWIDLARQIAGDAGVAALGASARTAPPGTESLRSLFKAANGPVLFLLDEVLNFVNRHKPMSEPFCSFVDNLVRAATGTQCVAAVLSLPKSNIEMTPFELTWQDRITKVIGRIAKDLIANDEAEVSEVIRRRLFEDLGLESNIKKVARAYADWCFDRRTQLPPEWIQVDTATSERSARDVLRQRFEACYPFHPSTLSVFQRKWQSLSHYQQTRGTLAMLAQWLSCTYPRELQQNTHRPLITLGSAPLDDPDFRAVVLHQIGEPRLSGAIDADIAGTDAHAAALDADNKGALRGIHRSVGAAIFFECSGGQTEKAAHLSELRFALGSPDIELTTVDTASAALESKSFYIRRIGTDGFRIGPKPKLNKVMADRRVSLDYQRDVRPACLKLVREVFEQGAALSVIPFPEDAASSQDTPRLVLVIADPATEWDRNGKLRQQIAEWTLRRSASPRLYPASLIWCVRKSGRDLADRVGSWLAWQRVQRDLIEGVIGQDVDAEERQEVQAKAKEALNAAKDAVWAEHRYVVFADAGEPDRIRAIDLGAGHSSSNETLSGRVLAALRSQGLFQETIGASYINRKWPPALAEAGAWPLTGLRQSFLDGSLTRLLDPDKVLRGKIIEFVIAGEFGLAAGLLPDGYYQRVWFKETVEPEEVTIDPNMFLLRKEVAARLKAPVSVPAESSVAAEPTLVSSPPAPASSEAGLVGGGGQPKPVSEQKPQVLRVSGEVPPEAWNRIGNKLIPKLRSTANLQVRIDVVGTVEQANGSAFVEEVAQIIQDLGLQAKLSTQTE
jgi:hypothetical protein